MGTWCTEGVKRTRRDNERVERLNSQRDSLAQYEEENDELTAKVGQLKRCVSLLNAMVLGGEKHSEKSKRRVATTLK